MLGKLWKSVTRQNEKRNTGVYGSGPGLCEYTLKRVRPISHTQEAFKRLMK